MKQTHAIVVGAGIAGLGSAAVLSRHYDKVTIVEKDDDYTHQNHR